jgi:uncharacterized repeat protein (TIGR01451 family)
MSVLIQSAIKRGVAYDDPTTITWLGSHGGCISCHILPEAMMGGENSYKIAPANEPDRRIILNTARQYQNGDGSIWQWGAPTEETLLFQWGLTAWHNPSDVLPMLVNSGNFMANRMSSDNAWHWDHCDSSEEAWFYLSDYSANAIGVYNLNHIIQETVNNPSVFQQSLPAVPWGLANYSGNGDRRFNIVTLDETGVPYIEMQDASGAWHIAQLSLDGSGNYTYLVTLPGVAQYFRVRQGTVYANIGGTISVYDFNGHPLAQSYAGSYGPFDINSSGTIYAVSADGSSIYTLSSAGATQVTQGFNGILALAISKSDQVDFSTSGAAYQLNADGSTSTLYGSGRQTIYSMAVGTDGRLMLGIDGSNSLTIVTPSGGVFGGYGGSFGSVVQLADGSYLMAKGAAETYQDGYQHLINFNFAPYTKDQATNLVANLGPAIERSWTWWQPKAQTQNLPPISTTQGYNGGCQGESSSHASSGDYGFTLIALGNFAQYFDYTNQPAKATQARALMAPLVDALRKSQRVDGSWDESFWNAGVSDPLTTAIVGYSLQYASLPASDPMLINAINYELNSQLGDGSWQSSYMTTHVASTDWVTIFLPIALNQIGSINSDLYLTFPPSVSLENPAPAPTDTNTQSDGSTQYHWNSAELKSAGQGLNFNLSLANLLPNEVRPVALDAHLSLANTYAGTTATQSLSIPVVTVSDGLGLTVGTDQTSYGANNPVAITAAVSNTGAVVQGGSVHLVVYAASGTQVADLGSQPFSGLAVAGQDPINANWNTGTLLPNAYYVQATLLDSSGNVVSTTQSNFTITSSSATGSLLGAGVSTDKASYGPLDTVQLDDRITNLTSNTLAGSLTLATTITGPSGTVVWTHRDSLQQLTAGNYKDFAASIPVSNAADGTYNVGLVVTDSNGAQQASAHNSYKVQSTATSGQGITGTLSLSAATLKNRQLTLGDTLTLTASISNQGNAALSNLPITISIIDPASGKPVTTWTDTLASLATGGSSPLTHTWSSSGSNNQALVAVVSSSFTSNTWLAQAPFSLVVPPLTLSYNADKASYDINSTVKLTSTVNSQSALAITGLTLNEQITGPNNSVFWQHSVSGQTVSASAPLTYPDSVPLGLAAPGTYTATLSVLGANGVLQAQGSTHFTVNSSSIDGAGIIGGLNSVANVAYGGSASLSYTLTDNGNAALGSLPLQVGITNNATGAPVITLPTSLASLAQGASASNSLSWSTQGLNLPVGTVLKAVLQAQFGSGWITEGQAQTFTLTLPVVSASLDTPAASYGYNSSVSLNATLSNKSVVGFNPATVTFTLKDPNGNVINTGVSPATATLAAANGSTPGTATVNWTYAFSNAAPGNYTLSAVVTGNGLTLATIAPVTLNVASTAQTGTGVSGALATNLSTYTAGVTLPIGYSLSDAGNAPLSNLPVQILVTNLTTNTVTTLSTTVTSLAQGSSQVVETPLSWSSSGIPSGTPLQAKLQAQFGSIWITLDTQSFTLSKPVLNATLGAPAASYAYNSPVSIPLALSNQSPVAITPATVTWILTDPSGHAVVVSPATSSATVPAATGSGSSLVAGTASVAFLYTFGSATPGTYTLSASVSGNSESLAAAAPVKLVVTSTALTGAGISGQLGALTGNTAGTSVPISFTVADIGNAPLSNQPVRVVIANVATGQTLASPATTLASVAMGGTPVADSVSWNSSGTVSGTPLTATLQAQFNGSWINLYPAQSFTLVKPVVTATLGNPAPSYAYNGLVSIPLNLVNASTVAIAPANVVFTLSNATGTAINTAPATVASLSASGSTGSTTTATYTYTFVSAAPGNYSLTASVSGNGESLVSATPVTLVVSSTAQTGAGLSATLSATPTAPNIGQTVVLGESLSNAGNAALNNLSVTLTLSQGTTVVQTFNDTVSSLAAGALNQNLAHNWVPTAAGTYTEKLTATVGTNVLTLATGTLTVAQTPVKISVTPVAGSHGRVLVYLSCKPGEREGQGNPNNPNNTCLTQRQATLASYFGSLGVSYSVVTDDDAFTLALRSGRYNSYWLLGSITPVEDDLVDELREAVNRGDSLVLDSGPQGNSNYALYHIAGVSYQGHLTFGSNSLSFTAPVYSDLVGANLSSASGWTWFSVYSGSVAAWWNGSQNPHGDNDHEPGNDDPSGWNQCGWNYGSNNGNSGSGWNNGSNGGWNNGSWSHGSSTQYPAIVSNQYGQGKTLALAFDLVASLQAVSTTTAPVNNGWSKLLADSLGYSTPAALSRALVPGEAYSASFPVQNQGQAVNLYANLVQPTGGSYLGANLTGIAQSNGSEQFSLGLASSQTLNLITDQLAPASSGSYNLTLSAQTNATPPTSLGSFVYSLSVGATQASRQSTVSSEINAIPLTLTNTLSLLAARSYYASAQGALSLGNVGGAIDALADAGEALGQISGTQASTARADLDLLLKLVESRWQPPVKPGNGH